MDFAFHGRPRGGESRFASSSPGETMFEPFGVKPPAKKPPERELTQIKCYRDWEVDEGSADRLTHIRGYATPKRRFENEHEEVFKIRELKLEAARENAN